MKNYYVKINCIIFCDIEYEINRILWKFFVYLVFCIWYFNFIFIFFFDEVLLWWLYERKFFFLFDFNVCDLDILFVYCEYDNFF